LNALFNPTAYPSLLVGLENPDDAAVFQLDAQRAVISTVDFFPPVVDDPYDFGAIAAANALSDVYAMGGTPLMAINLVAWLETLDREILTEILRGGAEKVREAGAVIGGGHTITDKEPKYGLAVTGLINPADIRKKGGARAGDVLILSKALGTGVVTTALKRDAVSDDHLREAVASMSRLNRMAAETAQRVGGVSAMTDVTGFGLIGHAWEMVSAASASFVLNYESLRFLTGAEDYARRGMIPGGTGRNRDHYEAHVTSAQPLSQVQQTLLYDPQTSGGLLMAVSQETAAELLKQLLDAGESAAIVGEVAAGDAVISVVT
jgi:selenide,water dikinase